MKTQSPIFVVSDEAITFKAFVQQMLDGTLPQHASLPSDVGVWKGYAELLHKSYEGGYESHGKNTAISLVKGAYNLLIKQDSNLKKLMELLSQQESDETVTVSEEAIPVLPASANIDYTLATSVRAWLDAFIARSSYYSPRGHRLFHEAMGVWILSALAARRLRLPIDDGFYPSLYVSFCASTSKYAKSTTAKIAQVVMRMVESEHLLIDPNMSPQSFIQDASGQVSPNWEKMKLSQQAAEMKRLAHAGQRSMVMDELGERLGSIMQQNSSNHVWQQILLEWKSCPAKYTNTTIGRGREEVDNPYLSVLGCMTIDHMQSLPRSSNPWKNGMLSRFVLLTPPANEWVLTQRPTESYSFPEVVLEPLRSFLARLDVPYVSEPCQRQLADGKLTAEYEVERGEFPVHDCTWDEDAIQAYHRYGNALYLLVNTDKSIPDELHGHYIRLHENALATAMLLAWMDNGGHITLAHWAAAQEIAERWRVALHECYNEVNHNVSSATVKIEEKVLRLIRLSHEKPKKNHEGMKARDLQQAIGGGITSKMMNEILQHLEIQGAIIGIPVKVGNTSREVKIYVLPDSQIAQTYFSSDSQGKSVVAS